MLPLHRVLTFIAPLLPQTLRFRLWRYLCIRGRRIWPHYSTAQRVEGRMYIKMGVLIRPTEGLVTEFVRKHTNIPVPVVIDNVTVGDSTVLVLSELPGEMVRVVRRESGISEEQSRWLSRQISTLLAQLRAISPPSDAVSGFDNTPVYCERIGLGSRPTGPWSSAAEFHAFLLKQNIKAPPDVYEKVWNSINTAHGRTHRICLTHNDFAPQNILVDEHYNVTGIVDWEAAAWMPEYWEYTKSIFLPWNRKGWWFKVMSDAFPQYEVERQAEFSIWKYREEY
ncbi:hypothetical protein QCA50_014539 [Cerrena zonata]|uniref:Aminoglycoside phosphotransferase domain-containing protein n=1 Tax=Cerrena zonata TaxID=2478898 RepID=A0AAW0FRZ7_9APHY